MYPAHLRNDIRDEASTVLSRMRSMRNPDDFLMKMYTFIPRFIAVIDTIDLAGLGELRELIRECNLIIDSLNELPEAIAVEHPSHTNFGIIDFAGKLVIKFINSYILGIRAPVIIPIAEEITTNIVGAVEPVDEF